MFNTIDVDGSGVITQDNVMNVYEVMQAEGYPEEVQTQFSELCQSLLENDANNDNQITFDEFVNAWQSAFGPKTRGISAKPSVIQSMFGCCGGKKAKPPKKVVEEEEEEEDEEDEDGEVN